MKCLFSKSAGALIVPKQGSNESSLIHVIDGEVQDTIEAQHAYSAVCDWNEIEGDDVEALTENAISEYWVEQIASILRLAIAGLEKSLELRVLEQVEESLIADVSGEKLLNQLLIAPLLNEDSSINLAKSALSKGLVSTAGIIDELVGLQPLLRKFSDHWLLLGEDLLSSISESREAIWLNLVNRCLLKKLLNADSRRSFGKVWSNLLFHYKTPMSIAGINRVGKELSNRLFSHEKIEEVLAVIPYEEVKSKRHAKQECQISGSEILKTVEKQISAIEQAVAEGNDVKGESFLIDLIAYQTSFSDGEDYLVKSLCRIAQTCADMFRMDFESKCLHKALKLKPYDAWTLVQHGDHLKRLGEYDKALEVLGKAELGEKIVAKSSIADIYSMQSDYAKAIETYKAIPDWVNISIVKTAIADNLRKKGDFEESTEAYEELIRLAQQGDPEFDSCEVRAKVGLAEIAKNQGDFKTALQIYNKVLIRSDLDQRERIVYKTSKSHILKLMEKYDDAYVLIDEVIREYPFEMKARFTRASILGLIGKEQEGLADLSASTSSPWGEWLRGFYRGLLLLKLKQYSDAKDSLIGEISSAVASKEDKSMMRMAVALCYISEGNTSEANSYLSEILDLHDCHAQYLSLVLKLHIAKQDKNSKMVGSLKKQITEISTADITLNKAVKAINSGNLPLALIYETNAFLKLVA